VNWIITGPFSNQKFVDSIKFFRPADPPSLLWLYRYQTIQNACKSLLFLCLDTASDPPQQQQNKYDQKDQSDSAAGIRSPTFTVAPGGQGADEQNGQNDYQDNSHDIPPLISLYPLYFPTIFLISPIFS
jgi:hypothetical protein